MQHKSCAVLTRHNHDISIYEYKANDVYDIVDEVEAYWPDFENSESLSIFDAQGDTIAWLDYEGTVSWEYAHDYRYSDWWY